MVEPVAVEAKNKTEIPRTAANSVHLGSQAPPHPIPSMVPYPYELPTTGAISFTENCIDASDVYTTSLVDATTARANLRSVLKEHKHTAGEKDYLRIIKASVLMICD